MFIAALLTVAKVWKHPKCPLIKDWVKKKWCIFSMGYYLATRKGEILPFMTTWMDLENIMLSKISQKNSRTICLQAYVGCKTENNK